MSRMLEPVEVAAKVGVSIHTLYKWNSDHAAVKCLKGFPEPVYMGRLPKWWEPALDEYLSNKQKEAMDGAKAKR